MAMLGMVSMAVPVDGRVKPGYDDEVG